MNSFSIQQYKYEYEHQPVLDSYKQWLTRDLYANLFTDKVDDPAFLQKLSFFQAEGIRHDIGVHAAVTHASIQSAGNLVGQKIQSAASLISSSLDDGFSLMNNRMVEINSNLGAIGQGINSVNQTMQQGNEILTGIDRGIARTNYGLSQINRGIGAMTAGINAMNQNMMAGMGAINENMMAGMAALSSNIAQAATAIIFSLQTIHGTMQLILDELRIPESQRERRYHIEEGMKYFNKGMQSGDCLYFDDALDEFTKATSIERKDFFSWYYIGMIHLYSKNHLNLDEAWYAFDRYMHYAEALPQRHNLFDEALMMKAECCYLMQDTNHAYQIIEELIPVNNKAALRAMKYLSASTDEGTKKQAVEILKQLMQVNPYIVMQVLEDYDLLSNSHILQYIQDYKKEVIKESSLLLATLEKDWASIGFYRTKYDLFNKKLQTLKAKNKENSIAVVDALRNLDELKALHNHDLKIIVEEVQILKELESIKNYPETYNKIFAELSEVKNTLDNKGNLPKNRLYSLYCKIKIFKQDLEDFRKSILNDKFIDGKQSSGKYGYTYNESAVISYRWNNKFFHFKEGLASVQDSNGKWGYIDWTNQAVIPCQWISAKGFSEGLAAVTDSNVRSGFIDKTGRLVIPCQWNWAEGFSEGLARVADFNGYGYIDKTGRLVIPCQQWKWADEFSEGLARVRDSNGKHGYIDKTGRLVIPCKWENVVCYHNFSEGLAVIKDFNGKYGYIDKTGRLVIPCQWKEARNFHEGLAEVESGYIDKTGRLVPFTPYYCYSSEGLPLVRDSNGKHGYIDKTGSLVIPCQWNSAESFSEGLARVQDSNGNYGYIDKTGRLVIPCQWNWAEGFSEGLARVRDSNWKFGYIDKTGRLVIPCQWNWAEDFSEGLARVRDSNGYIILIDKTGNFIL